MAEGTCPACGHHSQFTCPNCGHTKLAHQPASPPYMMCLQCRYKWSSLKCTRCGVDIRANQIRGDPLKLCFIATELYGPDSLQVATLRQFRDQSLLVNYLGIRFVRAYYHFSPAIIPLIRRSSLARAIIFVLVSLFVSLARWANRRADLRTRPGEFQE